MTTHSPAATEQDKRVINWLMRQLMAIFPAWNASLRGLSEKERNEQQGRTKAQWLEGLIEAGLTTEGALYAGLSKARQHDSPYLPSVGMFIKWCEEAALETRGMPTELQAYLAWSRISQYPLKEQDWTREHPAVYWAAQQLAAERFNLMQEKYEHRRRERFRLAWRSAIDAALSGYDFTRILPPPPEKQEPPKPTSKERAAEECGRLLALFDKEQPSATN